MPVDSIARGMAAAALANGGSGALTIGTSGVSGATAGQILTSDGSLLQAGGAGKLSSLALGGATIGSNALAVTGTSSFGGQITTSVGSTSTPIFSGGLSNYGLYWRNGGNTLAFSSNSSCQYQIDGTGLTLASNNAIGLSSSTPDAAAADTLLKRDAAGVFAQVNGTAAQKFNVYATSSSANANFARAVFDTNTAGTLTIGTETLGTGVGTFGKIKVVS